MTVNVHRNLNWMGGQGYSILDRSFRVLDRKLFVVLTDCTFVVHPAGARRAVETGVRNVHAFVRGELVTSTNLPLGEKPPDIVEVKYYPFDDRGFYTADDDEEIWTAPTVWFCGGKAYVR